MPRFPGCGFRCRLVFFQDELAEYWPFQGRKVRFGDAVDSRAACTRTCSSNRLALVRDVPFVFDLRRKTGAAEETRTPDPIITNDVLYQLSYSGTFLVWPCYCPAKPKSTPASGWFCTSFLGADCLQSASD